MAFSIKNPEVDRLVRELARETGESLTDTILHSLQERLERLRGRRTLPTVADEVAATQARLAALPLLDDRSPEELLGYDSHGLPDSVMVLDTSALFALLTGEPEATGMASAVEADPVRMISASTLVEIGIVVEARYGDAGGRELDLLLHRLGVETIAVTAEQAEVARSAWRRFGKGRHRAGLNYGDTFAYALSAVSGEALLFKGGDFEATDVHAISY